MREIKFRGKCIQSGKWVIGFYYYCTQDNAHFILTLITTSNYPHDPESQHQEAIIVDPATVGQYIELKDANGVEVYEGDRLRCTDEERDLEWTTVVRYQDTAFVIDIENEEYNVTSIGFINFDYTKLEVIGNIHTKE